jgi:DNA polymerase delta, subunit 4
MPTTRRSTGSGRPAVKSKDSSKKPSANQTKLAFHNSDGNRISKRGAESFISKDTKKSKELEAAAVAAVHDAATESSTVDLVYDDEAHLDAAHEVELAEADVPEEDELEDRARQVTDAQMKQYWAKKETLMKAPRAHLENSSIAEKILREWDVDGRYGASIP